MNISELKLVIIALVIMWISYIAIDMITQRKQPEIKQQPPSQPINTFEQDMVFLHFLIDKEIRYVESLLLPMAQKYISTIIRDEVLEKHELEVCDIVYRSLSENYKQSLGRYFSEDTLLDYITRTVHRQLTATCLKLNITVGDE